MEETDEKLIDILIAEFIGTFLVAIVTGFSYIDQSETLILKEFKNFLGIFLAIYLMRKISGAFYNPGVFIMFLKLKNSKFYKKHFSSYLMTQCLGSVFGYLFFNYFSNGNIYMLTDLNVISFQICFIGEFISTFVFYLVILSISDPEFNLGNDYTISTIGITCGIGAGSAVGGNLSGAGMNPAIGFGSCFVAYLNTAKVKYLLLGLIYFITPILAGFVVAVFYINIIKNRKNPFLIKNKFKQNK